MRAIIDIPVETPKGTKQLEHRAVKILSTVTIVTFLCIITVNRVGAVIELIAIISVI